MSRLLIGAPHKSSGKTTVTLGICAALRRRGRRVQPFKKGPDFIDPMWLGRAAGRPCYNLDFHTQGREEILEALVTRSQGADITLIEGNMGLFDSLDPQGTESNGALAALLRAPVILIVDVKGMTRSVVPLILGFQAFDPQVRIAGVILNKVAGASHEKRLREALALYTDLPLLGAIHRDEELAIDERHLGLIPSNEAQAADRLLEQIARRIEAQVELGRLEQLAASAPALTGPAPSPIPAPMRPATVHIGIARDSAFGFYYPDDLERFAEAGAELVPFDTLRDTHLPQVDGLFIGGGFPETHLATLEANAPLRHAIHAAIEGGLPCYAECGGLMYLARSITWKGERREMVGVLSADVEMQARPVGRGYLELRESANHPWRHGHEPGRLLPAHEFHYSRLVNLPDDLTFAYEVVRGVGCDGGHDGILYKNLLAGYAHLRDVAGHRWVERFVEFVRSRSGQRDGHPL